MVFVTLEYCLLPVSAALLGHIYPALQPRIANTIRYPQSSDSKPYYSEVTFGCSNTLGPHERKSKERTGIVP
jgi:hypothetical protein